MFLAKSFFRSAFQLGPLLAFGLYAGTYGTPLPATSQLRRAWNGALTTESHGLNIADSVEYLGSLRGRRARLSARLQL